MGINVLVQLSFNVLVFWGICWPVGHPFVVRNHFLSTACNTCSVVRGTWKHRLVQTQRPHVSALLPLNQNLARVRTRGVISLSLTQARPLKHRDSV